MKLSDLINARQAQYVQTETDAERIIMSKYSLQKMIEEYGNLEIVPLFNNRWATPALAKQRQEYIENKRKEVIRYDN